MIQFVMLLLIICCLVYLEKETKLVKPIIQYVFQFISDCFAIFVIAFYLFKTFTLNIPNLSKSLFFSLINLIKLFVYNLHYILPFSLLGSWLVVSIMLKDLFWITSFKVYCKLTLFSIVNNPILVIVACFVVYGLFLELKEK